jgi:hypothetical protein
MQNKSIYLILIFILLLIGGIIITIIKSNEDTWIKDEKGVWVTHGNPYEKPENVIKQHEAIAKAQEMYNQEKSNGVNFTTQCLGTAGIYAVDIVNVPRTPEDDLKENQCKDYVERRVVNFIELDQNGSIVRIY